MKRHAILIANSQFPKASGGLASLDTPERDIEQFAAILRDSTRNFTVHTLINKASHEINESVFELLTNSVETDDLVLFYYTGHGVLDNELHLCLATNDTVLRNWASMVSFRDIMTHLRTSQVRRVIIFLDCCYSGAAGSQIESRNSTSQPEAVVQEMLKERGFEERTKRALELTASTNQFETKSQEEGIWLLTASSASEPAHAERGGLGIFTRFLISGFSGEATTRPIDSEGGAGLVGLITVNGLFRHVHRGIQTTGIVQTPRLFASRASREDMVLAEIDALVGSHEVADFRLWDEASLLENIVPAYLLDEEFRFLHWNAAFQAMVAEPLRLIRGSHVETFLKQLLNWETEVAPRSVRDFPPKAPQSVYPRVHIESLKLQTTKWGYIDFTKVASHVRDHKANWCVMLNINYAQRQDEVWSKLRESMTREETWSRYAQSYDPIIADFEENKRLVNKVVEQIGERKNCIDIGAGTGSTTLRLLETLPSRRVHAIDVNYHMLKRLHAKLEKKPDLKSRTKITHADCQTALTAVDKHGKELFADATYDGCVMTNVLFALDNPKECLAAIFRVLKPGGILALSTSDEATDIEALFRSIQTELEAKGNWNEQVRDLFNDALMRNREILPIVRRYTEKEVTEFLAHAGFQTKVVARREYVGCVFIVRAVKPN